MRTYPYVSRGCRRALRLLGGLVLLAACALPAGAQQRRYLVELGAAGAYQSFDNATDLGGAPGGVARLGVWLPLNFSIEVEGGIASPKTQTADQGVSVKTFAGSALYNILVGRASSFYLKAGLGTTKYGGSCPSTASPGAPICGSSGALVAGLGFRAAVAPTVMIRTEGVYNRNKSTPKAPAQPVSLSNFGLNVGVSLMLGSKPILDEDGDGVLDNRDRCPDTPVGASVDARGCPQDSDNDGVPDGVDRCPSTIAGAAVDVRGCSQDSDGDNIPDGIDKCPDTPAGVLVDPRGCPRDSDGDSIPDGLDRCSDTPAGATVDALGCPGDEDGDGVLDGLDRCPRTPTGAAVDARGCSAGQQPTRPAAAAPTTPPAPQPSAGQPPPRVQPDTVGRPIQRPNVRVPNLGGVSPGILPDVGFAAGTARLSSSSYAALDSLADLLTANPKARVEVGAHTDASGSGADDLRITALQAEAVRDYLVVKGVSYQQIVPRGYGSSVPLTPDTTPRGRAANRRVEIRPLAPGP
jgi:outer membrane protein OmpA-like peptidoglycan-associated protein